MAELGDKAHIEKMDEMKNNYMNKPEAVKEWFAKVQKNLMLYLRISNSKLTLFRHKSSNSVTANQIFTV